MAGALTDLDGLDRLSHDRLAAILDVWPWDAHPTLWAFRSDVFRAWEMARPPHADDLAAADEWDSGEIEWLDATEEWDIGEVAQLRREHERNACLDDEANPDSDATGAALALGVAMAEARRAVA